MNIFKTKRFTKSYKKLHQKIQMKFAEKLKIFIEDPSDIRLRNHSLQWEYQWLRSIDITWDYRLIFREYWENAYEYVDVIDIWTHSQLYK